MKAVLRLVAGGATAVVAGLTCLPLLVVAVVAGQLRQASVLASQWDIPAELVPVFTEAGQAAGIPWFLLAAAASVATDFGRHAPDGTIRGDAPPTSIFPVVGPPIVGPGGGLGMFLVDPSRAGPGLSNPQDDRAAADWLGHALGTLAASGPRAALNQTGRSLSDPDIAQYWASIIALVGLRIAAVAPTGGGGTVDQSVPASAGGNPIRLFGAALLGRMRAPVSAGNLDAIDAWAAGEGSCARFNPLDTTQPEPGATPFNTLTSGGHVWNYVSFDQGVEATTSTILNGLYQPVVAALQYDAGVTAVERAVRQSPWGTGPFGSPAYSGRPCASPPPTGAVSPAAGQSTRRLAATAGPTDAAAVIVARAARYQAIWNTAPAAPTAAAGVGARAKASYVLPVDPSWFQAHPDWLVRPHHDFPAIDVPVPEGTSVVAVTAGQVVASDEAAGTTSCGHDVRLLGGDGVVYTYCHGSQVLVSIGQPVAAGQLIMRSGWSGNVVPSGPAGAHLHFQIDIPGHAGPVCPQPALTAWAAGLPYEPRRLPASGCVAGNPA